MKFSGQSYCLLSTLFILDSIVPVLSSNPNDPWKAKYQDTADLPFSGFPSFAQLPFAKCLDEPDIKYDVAILGAPFDSLVTYRPGARFGPFGIRAGCKLYLSIIRGYTNYKY